jgi:hypothetical protein
MEQNSFLDFCRSKNLPRNRLMISPQMPYLVSSSTRRGKISPILYAVSECVEWVSYLILCPELTIARIIEV